MLPNREFSEQEYQLIDRYLGKIGYNRMGCGIRWEPNLAFGVYRPGLAMIGITHSCEGMIHMITPCVVHELTHRKQHLRAGSLIGYYFGLFFLRYWWEKEAVAAEREAERLLGIDLGD